MDGGNGAKGRAETRRTRRRNRRARMEMKMMDNNPCLSAFICGSICADHGFAAVPAKTGTVPKTAIKRRTPNAARNTANNYTQGKPPAQEWPAARFAATGMGTKYAGAASSRCREWMSHEGRGRNSQTATPFADHRRPPLRGGARAVSAQLAIVKKIGGRHRTKHGLTSSPCHPIC
jgi:hypothetical protein